MKERFLQFKNKITRNNSSRYGILLSVVALIEIIMIISVSSFAWVETISSIKISGSGKIDTYTYTNAEIGYGDSYSGVPINLANYFRASGNAHLSAASSADGKEFYFPKVASAGTGSSAKSFRKGVLSDKNTNYISFSLYVEAKGTDANFFFDDVPTFYIGSEAVSTNDVRVAITVANDENDSGTTRVYSYDEFSGSVIADVNGKTVKPTTIHAFKDYTDNDATDDESMLFSVNAGSKKLITVTLWLQNSADNSKYSGKTVSASNFKIVTAVKTTKINFFDRTSKFNAAGEDADPTWNWVGNSDAKVWVRTAGNAIRQMTKDPNDPTLWSVTMPSSDIGDKNGDLYFYRTNSSVTSNPQNNNTNYWKTKISDAGIATEPTYTAYGNKSSADDKQGLGTWGSVSQILLYSDNAEKVLPTPGNTAEDIANATHVTLKNSANIAVEMNYNNGFWRGYIPKDENSRNLTFSFNNNGTDYSISAVNRDITADESKYGITSATTGFWEPAITVQAIIPDLYKDRGAVSVTGGPLNATSVKVTKGTQVTFKATASDDYAFEGWYTNPECTENKISTSSFPINAVNTNGHIYYAKFQYKVRLTAQTNGVNKNTDGGTVQINDGTAGDYVTAPVLDGSDVTLKANISNSDDYEFMGWFDSENNKINNSDNQSPDTFEVKNLQAPINYFAHFQEKTFALEAYATPNNKAVTFSGNEGDFKFETDITQGAYVKVSVGKTKTVKFVAVVDENDSYEFKGWYSDEACKNRVSAEKEYEATKNSQYKKLYAKFELKTYSMKAHAVTGTEQSGDGGTVKITTDNGATQAGANADSTAAHGTNVTFTATRNEESGYKFFGWYTAVTGGTRLSVDPEYTVQGVAAPIEAYARFGKATTVYFADRGWNKHKAYVYTADDKKTPLAGDWSGTEMSIDDETGYYKWYLDSSDTGDFRVIVNNGSDQYPGQNQEGLQGTLGGTYFFGSSTMVPFNPVNVSVNAVTFDSSGKKLANGFTGGSIKIGSSEYTQSKTLLRHSGDSFSATAQTTGNYEFKGWYKDENCTQSAGTDATLSATPSADITYYAKFEKSAQPTTVTITFIDNTVDTNNANNNHWVKNASATLWAYDTDTGNKYQLNRVGDTDTWQTADDVPATVKNITFYRCTDAGFSNGDKSDGIASYWNKWGAGARGTSLTYEATGDGNGSWK